VRVELDEERNLVRGFAAKAARRLVTLCESKLPGDLALAVEPSSGHRSLPSSGSSMVALGPFGGGRRRFPPPSSFDLTAVLVRTKSSLVACYRAHLDASTTYARCRARSPPRRLVSLIFLGKMIRSRREAVVNTTMSCRLDPMLGLVVTRSAKVAVLHARSNAHTIGQPSGTAEGPTSFCRPPLQTDRAGSVFPKQGTLADVAAKHRRAPVAGLVGHEARGRRHRQPRLQGPPAASDRLLRTGRARLR
jgi:hypothetical protein